MGSNQKVEMTKDLFYAIIKTNAALKWRIQIVMTIEKSSSDHIILDSGSAITYSNTAELSFSIKMDAAFSFILVLKFESTGEKQHELKQSVSDNTITLTCVNFDNPLGTGTTKPIELATFNGKKIYVNFWVYALGDKSLRKIVYSFYSER